MNQPITTDPKYLSIEAQIKRGWIRNGLWALFVLAAALFQSYAMGRLMAPVSLIAWLCFFTCVGLIIYEPRNGVFCLLTFSFLGDALLMPWYPFRKNLSSAESLLYFSDSFSFSPFELCLALTLSVWFLRMAFQRKWRFRFGPVFWPLALFSGCVMFSLLYGISRGGDRVIALWEARSLLYILPAYWLTVNLIERRSHVQTMLWLIILPNIVNGIVGSVYTATELKFKLAGVEAIGEHALSIHFNAFFIIFFASMLFRTSAAKRTVMWIGFPVVLLAYAANNRRASFITMGIAMVIIFLLLLRLNKQKFWLIVPPLAAFGMLYVAIFWNSSGALGAPAKAVRSVFGQADPRDAASNIYRVYENINNLYTIHKNVLLGVGFGNKFMQIVPTPDISFFEWWEYIVHNSILWIWMDMGALGFLSMAATFGTAFVIGGRRLWETTNDEVGIATVLALSYLVVFFVYAYVDMAWEVSNMGVIGIMMGLVCAFDVIARERPAVAPIRWPWQQPAAPQPSS